MASIRRRGTRWQVLYRHGGRQRGETFPSERGAREFAGLVDDLGAEEALKILDEREDADVTTPTLEAWCLRYIEHLTGVTEGTRARYRRMVELNLGKLARRPVDAITADSIASWVNAQAAAGLSGKTIANRHGFLSGALRGAVRARLITSNPCEGTRLPKTERKEMCFLTGEEFASLLAYVRPDSQDLVATLAGTGLRWGEVSALQARDIDVERQTLTVSRSWKWTPDGSMVLGAPKTSRSRRTIALPEQIVDIMRRRLVGLMPEDLVFTNPHGEAWKEPAFHSAVWQPAVHLANGRQPPRHRATPAKPRLRKDGQPWGQRKSLRSAAPAGQELGKKPRIHDLRHTCASWMIRDGVPLTVIQYHLGHESITTTIDRYGHLQPEHMVVAAGALTGALTNALPQIEG